MNADIDRKRGLRLAPWALAIALWGVLLMSAPVRATDVVVTSPGDDGTANTANCPGASCRAHGQRPADHISLAAHL